MRIQSCTCPELFVLTELKDGYLLTFHENICQVDGEIPLWEADRYTLKTEKRSNPESFYAQKEQWLAQAKEAYKADLAAQLRQKRDRLLAQSDQAMLYDRLVLSGRLSKLSEDPIVLYRQKLRDLPQQPNFPFEAVFPDKPEGIT